MIEELLAYNKEFVETKKYESYVSDKYPNKKIAILSCMDTRLVELLPVALGLKNGDIKLIKNAGAVISTPYGSVMRSLLVAVYDLGVDEILVIGHTDCGMLALNSEAMQKKMLERNIQKHTIDLVKYSRPEFDRWLTGFSSVEESVKASVSTILQHPLVPEDVHVYGLIMDPHTGKVDRIC